MRTKIVAVVNMTIAYAATGTINTTLSNSCVPTNNAKVPFCRPHSSEIHFLCAIPEAKYFAR